MSFHLNILHEALIRLQIFTPAQEKALMKYLIDASNLCFGLSRNEMRRLAVEFGRKIGVECPSSWAEKGFAGKDWYVYFMKRHNLSLRAPEHISANRMKAFNKTSVDRFFDQLKSVMTEHNFEPSRIWNIDETGLSTVPPKATKVIASKGAKRVGRYASGERGTMVTLVLAVNAAGGFRAPFFLFPRKNMRAEFLDHAPPGSVGFANGSGWMTKDDFVNFMLHIIKESGATKDRPSLLLLDNHTSHL